MKKIVDGIEVDMTLEEIAEFNHYEAIHNEQVAAKALIQYKEDRVLEYPNEKELIIALWELVVENRAETSISLQAKREAIKAKYPKPV